MIKYECDMCHKIFDGEDIDVYNMPRIYAFSDAALIWIKNGFGMPKDSSIITTPTHLCKDCAKKIADMMDVVVDK